MPKTTIPYTQPADSAVEIKEDSSDADADIETTGRKIWF
jgi:hypothetical protein